MAISTPGPEKEQGCSKYKLKGKTLKICKTAYMWVSFAAVGMCISIIGPTLLDLQHEIGFSNKAISIFYASRSLGFIIGSLTVGFLLDRFKIEQFLIATCNLTLAVSIHCIPQSKTLTHLGFAMFGTGITMGIINTGTNVCILKIWKSKAAPYLLTHHFFYGVGGFIGPMIAALYLEPKMDNGTIPTAICFVNSRVYKGFEYDIQSFTDVFINNTFTQLYDTNDPVKLPNISYSYTILSTICMLLFISIVIVYILSKEEIETSVANSEILLSEEENKPLVADSEEIKVPEIHFQRMVIILAVILTSSASGIEFSYAQMITAYAVKGEHNLFMVTGAYITMVYWVAFMTKRAISIFLSTKVRSAKLVSFDVIATLVSCILLVCFARHYVTWLWLGTAFLGFSVATLYPATITWVERYIIFNGKIGAAFTICSSIEEMIMPAIIGYFMDNNTDLLFYFIFGLSCICVIDFGVLCFVFSGKEGKYIGETELVQMNISVIEEENLFLYQETTV